MSTLDIQRRCLLHINPGWFSHKPLAERPFKSLEGSSPLTHSFYTEYPTSLYDTEVLVRVEDCTIIHQYTYMYITKVIGCKTRLLYNGVVVWRFKGRLWVRLTENITVSTVFSLVQVSVLLTLSLHTVTMSTPLPAGRRVPNNHPTSTERVESTNRDFTLPLLTSRILRWLTVSLETTQYSTKTRGLTRSKSMGVVPTSSRCVSTSTWVSLLYLNGDNYSMYTNIFKLSMRKSFTFEILDNT